MTAIGGYFELSLPSVNNRFSSGTAFQSARAAFFALLMDVKPNRVWMPRYICDAMLSPVHAADIKVEFYSIDDKFNLSSSVVLSEGDLLLYVNYFGINKTNVDLILSKYDPNQIVVDNSQSFFSGPHNCLASIYSPRKFFGLPDGGLLFTKAKVRPPEIMDVGSMFRMGHLVKRLLQTPESGYSDFLAAEKTLENFTPLRMSLLTQRLLEHQDFERARITRNDNFCFLHSQLSHFNSLDIDVATVDGPICYPLMVEFDLKRPLLNHRIFVPTYWPEVLRRVEERTFEHKLVSRCVPIPCDQRYAKSDMKKVVELIKNYSD